MKKLPSPLPSAWIGIDEAGKGDFFGPLVISAARVEPGQLELLRELGVGDSKALSDKRVHAIARDLDSLVPHHEVVLMPPRYNDVYAEIRNLNHLLAWGHAAATSSLFEKDAGAPLVLSDQFSTANLVAPRLKRKGIEAQHLQRTRAEDDPAVACASIFARAAFLRGLERLGKDCGVDLAKGAGPPVIAAGKKFLATCGRDRLHEVAKLHFKTTQTIGG